MRSVRCEEERMAKESPFRLRVPEGACTNGVRPDLKMPGKTGWSDDDMMAGIARERYYVIAWGGEGYWLLGKRPGLGGETTPPSLKLRRDRSRRRGGRARRGKEEAVRWGAPPQQGCWL